MREKDFPVEVIELKGIHPFLALVIFSLIVDSQTLLPISHGSQREIGLQLSLAVIPTWEILVLASL
jgi:hypothetical protein